MRRESAICAVSVICLSFPLGKGPSATLWRSMSADCAASRTVGSAVDASKFVWRDPVVTAGRIFPARIRSKGLAAAVLGLRDALAVKAREAAYNVGVIDGGISVNAIPFSARMEVDLRATTEARLDTMEESFRRVVRDAAGKHKVDRSVDVIGRRPSGHTPLEAPLVRAAIEATRLQGVRPALGIGSTDANVPMSMGIPAVSIGAGGSAGNIHTRYEWYDPTDRQRGLERLLLLVAATAGLGGKRSAGWAER